MVTIGMNYRVRPGKEKIFLDAVESVMKVMESIAGHESSSLYQRVGDGDPEYLILSRWTDEKVFDDFVRSDRFRKVTTWGQENVLAGRPTHTTYRS